MYKPAPKPILIQMYGGPGSGKSTLAAKIFAHLKDQKVLTELITEFAKDLTYAERDTALSDQFYVAAKQAHKYRMCRNSGVLVTISDTSLNMAAIYGKEFWDNGLEEIVNHVYSDFTVIHLFVNRNKEYVKLGRRQTEKEARALDDEFKGLGITGLVHVNGIDDVIKLFEDKYSYVCPKTVTKERGN